MTTEDRQTSLLSRGDEARAYEAQLAILLHRISVWSKLPDERTDWDLEQLLQEIGTAALALRRLRGDADLPF